MAHPGVTRQPALMAALVDPGLDAIEVYHSDHPPAVRAELSVFAARIACWSPAAPTSTEKTGGAVRSAA